MGSRERAIARQREMESRHESLIGYSNNVNYYSAINKKNAMSSSLRRMNESAVRASEMMLQTAEEQGRLYHQRRTRQQQQDEALAQELHSRKREEEARAKEIQTNL